MRDTWHFPFEQKAMRGDSMPEGMPLADQMAFTALRNLYWAYREKHMSREQASAEKSVLRRQWEQAKAAEAFENKLTAYHVRQRKAVERAASACRKEPTRENAIRLCDCLDGLEPGEGENGS